MQNQRVWQVLLGSEKIFLNPMQDSTCLEGGRVLKKNGIVGAKTKDHKLKRAGQGSIGSTPEGRQHPLSGHGRRYSVSNANNPFQVP